MRVRRRRVLGESSLGVAAGVGEVLAKCCWGERWGERGLGEGGKLGKGWSGKGLWLKLG